MAEPGAVSSLAGGNVQSATGILAALSPRPSRQDPGLNISPDEGTQTKEKSGTGLLQTRRWREPDSNPRSLHHGEPFRDRAGTWSFGVPGCFLNTKTDSAENGPRDPEL